LINGAFLPFEASQNQQTPLSNSNQMDTMIWPSQEGILYAKSAYSMWEEFELPQISKQQVILKFGQNFESIFIW